MDWSKIKTIFILTFLILDIFLGYQFVEKLNRTDLEPLISEMPITEQFEAEGITYVDIPSDAMKEVYLSGRSKNFSQSDIIGLENQKASIIQNNTIVSIMDTPIPFSEDHAEEDAKDFLDRFILHGDVYQFWGWNKESNKLLFFQEFDNKTIYFNEYGMLSVQLDGENQIIGYEQTMLEEIEEIELDGKKQILLSAEQSLENLYRKNELTTGDKVTKIEIGYYKLAPLSGNIQVFAPTWHIVVNENKNYFVNAVEGQIMEIIQGGVGEDEFAF